MWFVLVSSIQVHLRKCFLTIFHFQPTLLVSNILVGILLLIEELRQAPASISSASVIASGPGNDPRKKLSVASHV